MMKDNISHEEYRSKLANVADLAVSYINTGNGYFRMRDAFNQLAEQCGANKGINDEATVGRRKLLAQSVCIECISRLSSHSNDRLQGALVRHLAHPLHRMRLGEWHKWRLHLLQVAL